MVGPDVHEKVAAEITTEMDRLHRAFLTVTKLEITTALRRLGGQPRTRVGRSSADNVEAALERRGYKVFPALADVRTDEAVRIYRRGTFADQILQGILHPGATTDEELANIITKVKQADQLLKQMGPKKGP